MTASLPASYACCRRMAHRAASNFYYTFYLLPREQRRAMLALYAFLRKTDDLGDSADPASVRRERLTNWREQVESALRGTCHDPILPALVDTVRRFQIPVEYLFDVVDGVEMDVTPRRFETFEELVGYCHKVASAVGLACIHIWGFDNRQAIHPARQCGVAMQLTNILRDLQEDSARGRLYLPLEDLRRFDYPEEDLRRGVVDERTRALLQFQVRRAEYYYEEAASLHLYLRPAGRRVYGAMFATYRQLLCEISRRDSDVFTRRVRVSRWRRLAVLACCAVARPSAHRWPHAGTQPSAKVPGR
ncbi:MAG: phytoene/squalene synthase family protein [Pirellulales bacterium]